MTATDEPGSGIRFPPGIDSVETWEAQLDQTIDVAEKMAWRRLNPALVARLLTMLPLAIDDACTLASVRTRMDRLHALVHENIDRWKAHTEAQACGEKEAACTRS